VTRSRGAWWRRVAQEREWLLWGMSFAEVVFEARVAALRDLERQFLREARTSEERQQLQRLTAYDVLNEAFAQERPWRDLGPWLRRLRGLGFADLWSRHHIACLYVRSLPRFPKQARDAFALLADTERRVKRRRKDRSSRQQMLDAIAHARREAARHGLQPPEGVRG
jgi:hypothetical protein